MTPLRPFEPSMLAAPLTGNPPSLATAGGVVELGGRRPGEGLPVAPLQSRILGSSDHG